MSIKPDQADILLRNLATPGVITEVDMQTAQDLGAFFEDALSEQEALDAVADPYDEGAP